MKLSIEELERILDNEEDIPIEILPNGEIRATDNHGAIQMFDLFLPWLLPERIFKPLTYREDLGGEMAADNG